MTVCLAAMCLADADSAPMVVVAADRMVTLGSFIEFEHANPKMKQPSPSGIVMIAGNTLVGTSLASDVCDAMTGEDAQMAVIAGSLSEHFQSKRQQARSALFRSYASKRRAEAAPGVGLDTDIAVISRSGIRHLESEQLLQLKELFDGFQEQTEGSLRDRLDELTLEVLDDSET